MEGIVCTVHRLDNNGCAKSLRNESTQLILSTIYKYSAKNSFSRYIHHSASHSWLLQSHYSFSFRSSQPSCAWKFGENASRAAFAKSTF